MAASVFSGLDGAWDGAIWTAALTNADDAFVQNAVLPPTGAGPFTINSVILAGVGIDSLDFAGKTLNVTNSLTTFGGAVTFVGGTLNVGGNVTIGATGGVLNMTGGTLIIGAGLIQNGGTFTPGTGTLKLTNANHTITFQSNKTFAVVDASSLATGNTITFTGTFTAHTISSLTIPTIAATPVLINFSIPASKSLTISAITGNTMTSCTPNDANGTVTGTAAAPILTTTGAATALYTCTTAASGGGGSTPAPIFSTKDKATVFSEEVK